MEDGSRDSEEEDAGKEMDLQSFKKWESEGKERGPRHVAPDGVDPHASSKTKPSEELFLQTLFPKVSPGAFLIS